MASKKQPPVNKKMIDRVTGAINRMEAKQIALSKQPFTASDLLQLFVNPKHHEVLTRAYSICEPSGWTQDLFVFVPLGPEYGGTSAHMRFHWSGADLPSGFYVPYREGSLMDYPAAIRKEAPKELVERFNQVAHDMVDAHYRFARVRRVFDRLNRPEVCPSLAAMRYHWPCIVPILRMAQLHKDAEMIEDANARAGGTAYLLADLRKQLAATNLTIANHILVEDLPNPEVSPIAYELRHNFR